MDFSRIFQRASERVAGNVRPQTTTASYSPQVYQAPPQYQSFSQLFNQPQFDYSQVNDIYQRGEMPNNLLNRYNSLMKNLQAQQAAMVPRQAPQGNPSNLPAPGGQLPPMTRANPYVNFAQLFGGR